MINKDTKIFFSVSQTPGNFGARVYNYLFSRHGLNCVYLPRKAPENAVDLTSALKTLNIAGCSVSMPLKSKIIPHLDNVDPVATAINSVNTVVNSDGALTGYNTDYIGVERALARVDIDRVLIFGSGGVVGAVVHALKNLKCGDISLTSRTAENATAAAKLHGVKYAGSATQILSSPAFFDVLINATPASSDPGPSRLLDLIRISKVVFDFVASETPTPLITAAKGAGKFTISGVEMFKFQVQRQFHYYTGIEPQMSEIDSALK